jgi:hypothetical protein
MFPEGEFAETFSEVVEHLSHEVEQLAAHHRRRLTDTQVMLQGRDENVADGQAARGRHD